MSQADFHRESSSTGSAVTPSRPLPATPTPPFPPTPVTNQPAVPAPVPAPPVVPAAIPASPQPASTASPPSVPPATRSVRKQAGTLPPVPPPPPPRATLPPVRPSTEGKVGNGIGTAKGVRWRGELGSLGQPASAALNSVESDDVSTNGTDPQSELIIERDRFVAPPWLVSLVIHLVLLLLLAFITTPVGQGLGKLVLTMGSGDAEPSVELTDFEIASDDAFLESDSLMESDFDSPVDLENVLEVAELSTTPDLIPIPLPMTGGEASNLEFAPMFSGRTGAMKQALLARYGGTPETQEAVKMGLEWLKRNQNSRGYWSMKGPYDDGNFSENQASATAMALLAFMGDGHTHRTGDYIDEVEKGVKFLVKLQNRNGFMASSARGHEQMYAQAQATIALCELYGMTKDSWLRPRAELAVSFAEQAQSSQGGWRYQPNNDSDTSVTGWFVMALKSAQSAGLEVHDSKLRDVHRYLDTAQSYDGAAYSYQPRGVPSPAMTAEGLLCRQYLGWDRTHPSMVRGAEALATDYPFDLNDQDVYYWYYATQMLHHYGGGPWSKWNNIMRAELPSTQVKSGRERGSWSPQGDAYGSYGRLYTTCLSIYCMEVYYRHMPLYQYAGEASR